MREYPPQSALHAQKRKAWGVPSTGKHIVGAAIVVSAAVLFLSIVLVQRYISNSLQHAEIQSATIQAESINATVREFRTLYAAEVVRRVSDRGIKASHDYQQTKDDIPLPATLTKMIGKRLSADDTQSKVRLFSDYPFPWQTDGGPQTEIEREALRQLTLDPSKPFIQYDDSQDQRILYYATADIMRASCVDCHNSHPDTPKNDWMIGDVRGVLAVTIDLDAEDTASTDVAQGLARSLMVITLVSGGIVTFLFVMIVRWSRKENSQLQTALRSVENQKKAMDNHAIVSITDLDGKITYVNDKFLRISGYSRDELISQSHHLLRSGQHSEEFYHKLKKTISSRKVWVGEIKNRAKDGSHYWVITTIVPFADEKGRIKQYVSIQTDISTQRNTEEKLRVTIGDLRSAREDAQAANIAKSEFLANMSHEIRTPMTAILGFAEIIAENVENPEHIEAIEIIQRNCQYLIKIINDILDLSKIDARKMTTDSVPINPREIIAQVVSITGLHAREKGLTLSAEYDDNIPMIVHTDPVRLRQILINLIGNAIKFTENGGVSLTAKTAQEGDAWFLQIDVSDTGIGISKEQSALLFQPFSQADNSTNRKFGGTGLGLVISKRFAELLGGGITIVESQVGVGTRVRATIAIESPQAVTMTPDPRPEAPAECTKAIHADLSAQRILFAEDGPDNQRLILFVLKKAGATVTLVENGKSALDAALAARDEGSPFDCILMDMQMPIMSGYEATAKLRGANYTGPIIALTAHAMSGDREKCIKAGCTDFMNKPINRQALIAVIARHTAQSSSAA